MLGAMVVKRKLGQPTAAGAGSLMEEGRERCFRCRSCRSQSYSRKKARLKHDIPFEKVAEGNYYRIILSFQHCR